jgi:hypothetical protein
LTGKSPASPALARGASHNQSNNQKITKMIIIDGNTVKDEHGRTLILRGVNLGGSSKIPFKPNGATWNSEGFFDHREVSFVGRPFPFEEADEHLGRLKEWGFTFLRFLITWEAVEHKGPGIYDEAYLDYLYKVIKKAGEYGIDVFIDPHQDAWSRFSGGDGAPGWTFEVIGMDIRKFKETGAAIVHSTCGDPFPPMIWPTNYGKLANLTMWTLFFGGNDFAPHTKVDKVPIQEYLQGHYINAIKQVALKLKYLPNVVGFDTLNEPSAGMIGIGDLHAKMGIIFKSDSPTAFQAMLLGAGYHQEIEVWDFSLLGIRKKGKRLVNPAGVSVWKEGFEPIWKQNGVWDLDESGNPKLLRPDHFAKVGDRKVDFSRDYFRPFANRYAREIRSIKPDAIIFIERLPSENNITWTPDDAPNIVHAAHWYDFLTLFTKNFRSWITVDHTTSKVVIGQKRVRQAFENQIAQVVRVSEEHMSDAPTIIGEVGIPFDMKNKRAFRTGDFSLQVKALDATMRALEANLVSFTLWNYTADNNNERGDQWNDEDLSIFSRDQQTGSGDIHDGGRALRAAVRPYARKVAGKPLRMSFDIKRRVFAFEFQHDASVTASTELYIPHYQYPAGFHVTVSDGEYDIDEESQTLVYRHSELQGVHSITVREKPDQRK